MGLSFFESLARVPPMEVPHVTDDRRETVLELVPDMCGNNLRAVPWGVSHARKQLRDWTTTNGTRLPWASSTVAEGESWPVG